MFWRGIGNHAAMVRGGRSSCDGGRGGRGVVGGRRKVTAVVHKVAVLRLLRRCRG